MNVKLVVVQGKPAGKALLFAAGEYYLGRGPECQVRFTSDWVSRQHCLLRVTAEGAFLRDLGSRNGTLVNGTLLAQEQQLAAGDQVQVGPVVLEVHFAPPDSCLPTPPASGPLGSEGDTQEGTYLDATAAHPIWPSGSS